MTGGWVIPIDWTTFGPAFAMLGGALLALCGDLLSSRRRFILSWLPMLAGVVVAGALDLARPERMIGLLATSERPVSFSAIIILATLLIVLGSAVFADDTAAFFVGRVIGRHRLAPAISPGKSVEGFVAGTLVGVAVTFFALYEQDVVSTGESLLLGLAIALANTEVAPLIVALLAGGIVYQIIQLAGGKA